MLRLRIATILVAASTVVIAGARPLANVSVSVPSELPGQRLPVLRQHTYRMAGKVRMLLLWVGRDDVGSAIIKWRGAGEHKAFELLIGTDPQKAPGQLNKWGLIVEEIRQGESSVVGLISQENDDRLSDVKADLKRRKDQRAFDTIRGLVASAEAAARVGTLHAPSELTYRDADAVLNRFLLDTSLPIKHLPRSTNVRAGFLSALSELVSASIDRKPLKRIPYIHGDRVYELRLLDSAPLARFERDGRTFEKVIRSRFETGQAGMKSGTRFELVYGASGPLAGIPIVISYQPKWWLQVDLVLNT